MAMANTPGSPSGAPESNTSIILIDHGAERATIQALVIEDPDVVAWLGDQPAAVRDAEFVRALRIGVLALKAVNIGATVENVRAEFAKMRADLNGDLDGLFGERGTITSALGQHFGPDGTMTTAFEEYLGKNGALAQHFADALGEDGDFEHRIKQFLGPKGELAVMMDRFIGKDGTLGTTMEQYLGEDGSLADGLDDVFGEQGSLRTELDRIFGPRGDLVYKLLNPMSDETPLGKFRLSLLDTMDLRKPDSPFSALKRDLEEIKTALHVKAAVSAEAEKGTRKGMTWQDTLLDVVSNIALVHNDSMEDVGAEGGRGGKTGDQVVLLNTAHTGGVEKRIVFEAKNKPVTMKGKDSIWRELDDARTNRDAAFAVVAVNAKHRPTKAEQLQYSQPNNAIIVYVDEEDPEYVALEAAYTLARTLTLAQASETTGEISPEKVAQAVKRVNAALELIKGMKHSLTSAVTSIESVKQGLDTLREEVSDAMGELGEAVSG